MVTGVVGLGLGLKDTGLVDAVRKPIPDDC